MNSPEQPSSVGKESRSAAVTSPDLLAALEDLRSRIEDTLVNSAEPYLVTVKRDRLQRWATIADDAIANASGAVEIAALPDSRGA